MIKSFKEVFTNLIDNDNKLNIYFGKIIHKITEHRYNLNISNPIILTRLPSLYKFKVKGNDNLIKNVQANNYKVEVMEPVSISYIYIPFKPYDVMIYQFIGNNNRLENNYKIGKDKELILEVSNKENILEKIFGLSEDLHYKYNS